jgi:2-oxoglutarate dehydrogenase E2 component (dihydrolipoamide succinyltransferase)
LDEIPQNEPEPAPPAEAPQPEAAPPAEAPDPEAAPPAEAPTLLEQARTDPTLAQAIQAQLLANGDLEGYARACRELRAGGGLSVETAPGPGGTT